MQSYCIPYFAFGHIFQICCDIFFSVKFPQLPINLLLLFATFVLFIGIEICYKICYFCCTLCFVLKVVFMDFKIFIFLGHTSWIMMFVP